MTEVRDYYEVLCIQNDFLNFEILLISIKKNSVRNNIMNVIFLVTQSILTNC